MNIILICICIICYLLISIEHITGIHKTPIALFGGLTSWILLSFFSQEGDLNKHLFHSLGEIAEILFFLLGAMTIVELIDSNQGFDLFKKIISTKKVFNLMLQLSILVFISSALLDNLTSAIVGVSLARKLVREGEQRLYISGMIILAANAGGVWSPLGDITSTMLWMGGQLDAFTMMKSLILPAIGCAIVPMLALRYKLNGLVDATEVQVETVTDEVTKNQKVLILIIGLLGIICVPIIKLLTHLPPYIGMLFSVSVIWILVEWIHKEKVGKSREFYTISGAIQRIDTPSILFFLGILLQVNALAYSGLLTDLSMLVFSKDSNPILFATGVGLVSSVIDNVPLVAAIQDMLNLQDFPQNHAVWKSLAFTSGTGGSILIIGSAAGIAVMGMENIPFFWYVKRIAPLAIIGYLFGTLILWLTI